MKFQFFIWFLYVLNGFILTEDSTKQLKPIVLTADSFETHIASHPGTFIFYYAPWCGHCKKLFPAWNQLASRHLPNGKYSIAKIDCTQETELCSQHDILSYPTLIFYKKKVTNGDRYDGKRDLESLEAFMFEQLRQDRTMINRPTEENNNKEEALELLNENNFDETIASGYHFIKFFAPWCSHCKNLAPTWKNLAEKYHNSMIQISHVDCTKSEALCAKNKIDGYPTLLFFHDGQLIYNYQEGRSLQDLSDFIDEIVQDEEESNENKIPNFRPGQVLELDDNNFSTIVKDSSIIFVKFFAPYCSHCKRLEPTWNELALKLAQQEEILIAKVDCTANQELCQSYGINAYPKLVMFRDGKRFKDYTGSRDLENLYNFVIKNARNDEL